jgi:hypothetical protein
MRAVLVGTLIASLAVTATVAEAAQPAKGGAYVGKLSETAARSEKRVVLKVASSGKTGRVRLSCSSTRAGLSGKFDISGGKFTAKKMVGSTLVWRLKGKFSSRSKARATLYAPAVCDGKGGKVTLKLDD